MRIFKEAPVNVRTFISFQVFMNPGKNLSVGFTYITGVRASTKKLVNYIGIKTIWNCIFKWKKRWQFKCLETILILVPSLQNYFVNFCNLFPVNLENFPMKGNLKYRIFSLDLFVSVSLGMFMIFLLKYLLTDLSIYSLFTNIPYP